MNYQRILSIQDISCVGQCSLTVALPILSAAGHETSILPAAVLSTHSVGFTDYTFRDLTEDMPKIAAHWQKEGLAFDAFYTGYLGSGTQVDYVLDIVKHCGKEGARLFVDPAMADSGVLYPGFDEAFAAKMKELTLAADVLMPNITEAALLTGLPYKESYDEAYISALLEGLAKGKARTIAITGVGFAEDETGVMLWENGETYYHCHKKLPRTCHGTGDVFAASFVGACLNGKTAKEAAKIATDFVLSCIERTVNDEAHWYGVKFEPGLGDYIRAVRG